MNDFDTALTDFGLALECAFFVFLLVRLAVPRPALRVFFALLFAATGMAALLGGVLHGFLLDASSPAHRGVWMATLLCIGGAAVAGLWIAAELALRSRSLPAARLVAGLLGIAYAVSVLSGRHEFRQAVLFYAPAAALWLAAIAVAHRRTPRRGLGKLALGLLLSFTAALVQQLQITVDPRWLDHNAFYHLIQAVALWLLYSGARSLESRPA